MPVMTGLSGNEMYCLQQKGLLPGDLVVGNSVFSVGFVGSIGSGLKTLTGGEVDQITSVIHDGRLQALKRMTEEAKRRGGIGVTSVDSELIQHGGNVEFLSVGSCVYQPDNQTKEVAFTSSADGIDLYCHIDAGFRPIRFVFGNVAYSIGIGGNIMGALKSLKRGEVKEYSEVFNTTRHLALQRITNEARAAGANAVVGIKTSIIPFQGMQEMLMLGTASFHPMLPPQNQNFPITSDLTHSETWNLVNMGFMPLRLVLGVSVYSLGVVGGITAAFKSLARGEISELTSLIYEARANALEKIRRDAEACGADDVVGIKVLVYNLGNGVIEFMAIGTAVKRMPGLTTLSAKLPSQAAIEDKDTFINLATPALGTVGQGTAGNKKPEKPSHPLWKMIEIIIKLIGH